MKKLIIPIRYKLIVGSVIILCIGYMLGAVTVQKEGASNPTISVSSKETINSPELIALVNLDEGVMESGDQRVYYAQNLMDMPETGYITTNLEDARTGVREGRYAGYIVIPADFSENIKSVNSTLQKATVTYAVSEALEAKETKKTNEAIHSFIQNMNDKTSYLYVSSVMNEFHDAQRGALTVLGNDQKDLNAINDIHSTDLLANVIFPTLESNPTLGETKNITEYTMKNESFIRAVEEYYDTGIEQGKEDLAQVISSGNSLSQEWRDTQELLNSIDILHNEGENITVYENGLNALKDSFVQYNNQLVTANQTITSVGDNLNQAIDELNTSIENYNVVQLENGKTKVATDIFDALTTSSDTVSVTYNGDTQELEITIGQQVIPIPIRSQNGITIEPTDLEKAENELNQNLQMSGIDALTGTQADKDAYIKALKELYLDEQIPTYSLEQNVQDALKHIQEQTQVDLKMSLPDHSEDETKLIDADAISDYIRTQIVGKVESRANTVTSTLASRYSSQSEALENYQTDLSTFNPLQRVDQDAVKSQYSEMRKNNSELQDSISKDYALKTEYISSLLQTTQKNVDTLRQSVVDTEEESKNTIETGLKAAKNTKTITSEENQALLYAFTTKLPNTKVGDLENTTAYQFMVNPLLVTQDSVEKATVQENNAVVNTENKKNQTEKDYGIILLVLIGICVLSIGGAVMYRNKRRQKDSSPFDE